MAAFLPRRQIPVDQPLQNLSVPLPLSIPLPLQTGSPPNRAMFHLNNVAQQSSSTQNITDPRTQHRISGDHRTNGFATGDGPLPMPATSQAHTTNAGLRNGNGNGNAIGGAIFDGPRSPPNTKSISSCGTLWNGDELIGLNLDTSHVPCKFFRSGQCQAGKACPFSHSTDVSTVDTPCKYFSKV